MTETLITANLPSRDFAETRRFYETLGFTAVHESADWMILDCGGARVEFFPHPRLDPANSWFSACLRVRDLVTLHDSWSGLGLPGATGSIPRLTSPFTQPGAPRMFTLVDLDGSLWRVMEIEAET